MSTAMMGPQKLTVSILQAPGLQPMNHFIGDHPYVTLDVKGVDGHSHTQVETNSVTENDTTNPFWGETLTGNPWSWEQNFEFSVYDKGLVGSKTEGKVVLPHELFYPTGFSEMPTWGAQTWSEPPYIETSPSSDSSPASALIDRMAEISEVELLRALPESYED